MLSALNSHRGVAHSLVLIAFYSCAADCKLGLYLISCSNCEASFALFYNPYTLIPASILGHLTCSSIATSSLRLNMVLLASKEGVGCSDERTFTEKDLPPESIVDPSARTEDDLSNWSGNGKRHLEFGPNDEIPLVEGQFLG